VSARRDVVVVGAGPAGATVATLLARRGLDVLVLEKESFPRFRIGESLLPACLSVLARVELEPRPDTHVYKRGAEFVCEATGRAQSFAFADAMPGCAPHAWHVDRARFDTRLRDCARAAGAEVRHGEPVEDAGASADEAWVRTPAERVSARYLIDAAGQARLMARRMDGVEPYTAFGMAAVFTHFEGLGDAALAELGPHFDIRIMVRPEGWGWVIPLPDGRLSVGIVSRDKVTPAELDEGLLAGPLVRRLTAGARRLQTRIVGNFSYGNRKPHGERFATVGDAATFLDPVFSSGVTLALRGAEGVADAVGAALAAGTEARGDLLTQHQSSMERACRTFGALIHRFYHSRFPSTFFLAPAPDTGMRSAVISVLAGDVWRTGNPFQETLLGARRWTAKSGE
jgi:flavin-dependent dehydrogenase